jgi:hypothetical protein
MLHHNLRAVRKGGEKPKLHHLLGQKGRGYIVCLFIWKEHRRTIDASITYLQWPSIGEKKLMK